MATARVPLAPAPQLLVGQTVHFRDRQRCWAAAIVESGLGDAVQLYLFPLPPSHPMPQAPGTFVRHDAGQTNETWHRLGECLQAQPATHAPRRRRRRKADGVA